MFTAIVCNEGQVLLKHSADVNARDKSWQTPLHVAVSHKAVRCAEALVPLLSNVNVSDRAGRTALHHAAFSGHLEVRRSVFHCLQISRCSISACDRCDPFAQYPVCHSRVHETCLHQK